MGRLFIFGAGQVGETCAYYFRRYGEFNEILFSVDAEFISDVGPIVDGHPVVEFTEAVGLTDPDDQWFTAVAFKRRNTDREKVYRRLEDLGVNFASFVHPSAQVWDGFSLGRNVFIMENNLFQYKSSLGDDCIVWSNNHIGHHTRLGSHQFLASEVVISGNCEIGDNCFFGVNATVTDGVSIGPYCAIGAGAVVKEDLSANSVVR